MDHKPPATNKESGSQAVRELREVMRWSPFVGFKCETAIEAVIAELEAALHDRDLAIAEANRTSQKWMDGINECVGRKLDYGDPSSPDCASTALGKLRAELEEAQRDVRLMKEQVKVSDAGFDFLLHRANDLMEKLNAATAQIEALTKSK